jgi:choline dehydrogenase-like flavoprotein
VSVFQQNAAAGLRYSSSVAYLDDHRLPDLTVGFVRSSQARDIPDIQVHALPWSYPFPNQDSPARQKVDKRCSLTIMPTLIYPKSRGTLRLASADPTAARLIDPGYLTEPDDARVLLDGVELIRAVMASKLIADQVSWSLTPARTSPTAPRWPPNSPTAPPRSTTRWAPAAWAPTSGPWSTRPSASAASKPSASPTPRSCPPSPAATPTPPP